MNSILSGRTLVCALTCMALTAVRLSPPAFAQEDPVEPIYLAGIGKSYDADQLDGARKLQAADREYLEKRIVAFLASGLKFSAEAGYSNIAGDDANAEIADEMNWRLRFGWQDKPLFRDLWLLGPDSDAERLVSYRKAKGDHGRVMGWDALTISLYAQGGSVLKDDDNVPGDKLTLDQNELSYFVGIKYEVPIDKLAPRFQED